MNSLSTQFAPRPVLDYPFERGFSPEHGKPYEVADGVYWLRVPLPISLDHINLWLLRDGDGWVIVDSGFNHEVCKKTWEKVFSSFCDEKSINKIIVTHYHPDHIGLAAWLAHRCDCKIWISQGELDRHLQIMAREGQAASSEIRDFVQELGFGEKHLESFYQFFKVDPKPENEKIQSKDIEIITDNQVIKIGNIDWRIVVGNGHSPEHACLYSPELNLLISGDQALPRISSNISVYYNNKLEDPLSDWLDSCAKLRDTLPEDVLVLPSHQDPFVGLHLRMNQLIDDHHAQLNKLRLGLTKETQANRAYKILFDRELGPIDTFLAISETLAHINYLWHRGETKKTLRDDGVYTYIQS